MHAIHRCILCAALIHVAACMGTTSLHGDSDAATDATTDTSTDTSIPDIAPDEECAMPDHSELQMRTIDSVMLLDDARVWSTERLLVTVQLLSGCERLAGVEARIMPGDATDFIELEAWAWVPALVDCPPSAPLVDRVVTVPGRQQSNFLVNVTDASTPGGGLRYSYERQRCEDISICYCAADSPPGPGEEWDDCQSDCDCGPDLACVGYWGVAGPIRSCVRSCADFLDCQSPVHECLPLILDGVGYVCEHDASICSTDADCPAGLSCLLSDDGPACVDTRVPPASTPCECDARCPAGHRCVDVSPTGPSCEIPCMATSHCPRYEGMDPLACTDRWVCR